MKKKGNKLYYLSKPMKANHLILAGCKHGEKMQ